MSTGTERRRGPPQDNMGLVVFATPLGGELSDTPAYTVGELSPLGALLVGSAAYELGQTLDLKLEVPGDRSVTVSATVARCVEHEGSATIDVEFAELEPAAQVFVQEAILSEIVRQTEPMVLVVATGISSAIDLWADLDEIGCDARVVPTLAEGFGAVQTGARSVSTVLIDVREGACGDTVTFATYVLKNLPHARVVLFGITDAQSPLPSVECVPESAWTTSQRRALFAESQRTTP